MRGLKTSSTTRTLPFHSFGVTFLPLGSRLFLFSRKTHIPGTCSIFARWQQLTKTVKQSFGHVLYSIIPGLSNSVGKDSNSQTRIYIRVVVYHLCIEMSLSMSSSYFMWLDVVRHSTYRHHIFRISPYITYIHNLIEPYIPIVDSLSLLKSV